MKIKYRIWDKEYDEWCVARPSMGNFFTFTGRHSLEFNSDRYVLQIFTGQVDKNGVEIYEGDIVKYDYVDNCFGSPTIVGQIKTIECKLCINIDPISSGGPDGEDTFVNVEIIGNIFENNKWQLK